MGHTLPIEAVHESNRTKQLVHWPAGTRIVQQPNVFPADQSSWRGTGAHKVLCSSGLPIFPLSMLHRTLLRCRITSPARVPVPQQSLSVGAAAIQQADAKIGARQGLAMQWQRDAPEHAPAHRHAEVMRNWRCRNVPHATMHLQQLHETSKEEAWGGSSALDAIWICLKAKPFVEVDNLHNEPAPWRVGAQTYR